MREFNLTDRDLGEGRSEIGVEGELDMAVADQLQERLEEIAGGEQVLVDLGDFDFIDSTAIAVLLRAQRQRSEDGGSLAAFGATGQVRRVLEVTGLGRAGLLFERADEIRMRTPERA
jgi:anti-anti-sigma factor